MDELVIPIDGKETIIKLKPINIYELELDELNPRISFFRDNQVTNCLTEDQNVQFNYPKVLYKAIQ